MAAELAPSIRLNCVNPGPVATKMVEQVGFDMNRFRKIGAQQNLLKRVGDPDEVAQSVLFLADGSKSGYITGAQLSIDGGFNVLPTIWHVE